MPKSFRSHRQRRKTELRKSYGNPWDSSSNESASKSSSKSNKTYTRRVSLTRTPKKSSMKSANKTRSNRNISFREPLERNRSLTKSSTSSSHAVWRSVSSEK
jgi:hypothetical protein